MCPKRRNVPVPDSESGHLYRDGIDLPSVLPYRGAMPRGPRLDAPGALHHVMARGIERRPIFHDDADREAFIARLDAVCVDGESPLYAWCLLPNHFHLLVRTGTTPLSSLMRRLLTSYACAFNRRHQRVGHLLQGRFKSILVDEASYFLELVRYIHLNPLRAALIDATADVAAYRWSGHRALLGDAPLAAHDVDTVLHHFGRTRGEASAAYRQFVDDGRDQGRRPELMGGGLRRSLRGSAMTSALARGRDRWGADERILGPPKFVSATLRDVPSAPPRVDSREAVEKALALIVAHCSAGEAAIRSSCHQRSAVAARAALCFIAVHRFGLSATAVATQLGISPRSVVRALDRARHLASSFPDLADLLR